MTDIIDRYRSYTYGNETDAHAAAQTLEQFGLHPIGPLPLRTVSTDGEWQSWEIVCVIPEKLTGPMVAPSADPLDVEPSIDSHWDIEADDRDINLRRKTRDEY